MDAKQLEKLVRQNAAKAEKLAKSRQPKVYDPTVSVTRSEESDDDESIERTHFFKEMKRREF